MTISINPVVDSESVKSVFDSDVELDAIEMNISEDDITPALVEPSVRRPVGRPKGSIKTRGLTATRKSSRLKLNSVRDVLSKVSTRVASHRKEARLSHQNRSRPNSEQPSRLNSDNEN